MDSSNVNVSIVSEDSDNKTISKVLEEKPTINCTITSIIQEELDQLKQMILENVEKAIENGDSLEELESKTQQLMETASKFQTASYNLKRHYWWTKHKVKIIIGTLASGGVATSLIFLL